MIKRIPNFTFIIIALIFCFGLVSKFVYEWNNELLKIPTEDLITKSENWLPCKSLSQKIIYGLNKDGGWFNISFLTILDRVILVLLVLIFLYFVYNSKNKNYFNETNIKVIDTVISFSSMYWVFKIVSKSAFVPKFDDVQIKFVKSYYNGILFLVINIFFKLFMEMVINGNKLKEENQLTI